MIEKTTRFIEKIFFFFFPKGHPWDYVMHSTVSFAGTSLVFLLLCLFDINPKLSLVIASLVMLALGIIKEISDFRLGKTDITDDMLANFLGIGIAILVLLIFGRSS